MGTQTIRFQPIKRTARYACTCSSCAKRLTRTVTVEHTLNPWNANEAGQARSPSEVGQRAQKEADAEASRLAAKTTLCRDCEDAPNRTLLLQMAADPGRIFERSDAMSALEDRGQIQQAHTPCRCGADCCGGWKREWGYRITAVGLRRARKLAES